MVELKMNCKLKSKLGMLLLILSTYCTFSSAQNSLPYNELQPPIVKHFDDNGVNLATGFYVFPELDISIGNSFSGLVRSVDDKGADNFYNFIAFIWYPVAGGGDYGSGRLGIDASYNGKIYRFFVGGGNAKATSVISNSPAGDSFISLDGASQLSCSGDKSIFYANNYCILQLNDGTSVSYFMSATGVDSFGDRTFNISFARDANLPSGETLTFKGDSRTVVSSLGWILTSKGRVRTNHSSETAEASVVNLAHSYCDPNLLTCFNTAGALVGNSLLIGNERILYRNGKERVRYSKTTTVDGELYAFNFPSGTKKLVQTKCLHDYREARTVCRVYSVQVGSSSWYYSYNVNLQASTNDSFFKTTVTNPDGTTTAATSNQYGVTEFSNENRIGATYKYNEARWSAEEGKLEKVFSSGAPDVEYVYDGRRNVTHVIVISKGAEPSLVTSATYPETCANPKTCNKPITVTDQNGVTTVYSYHAQSGYVETITKPAVNGIQAQTRYKYEQKTPYVKNSSGSLVANPAVWVLTEVSECMTQTLNTCVGTADEKRIVYSDFTNNLLSQKMTVRNGDASINLDTVTEYDMYGNVVAVDGPRAGNDDKVFYFYDLMRQKTGEIGVDPDGSGPLPRQAIKTIYNDDGKVTAVNKGVTFGTTKADVDSMTVKQQATTEYSTDHGLPIVERFYAAGILEKVTQKSYDNKLRLDCVAQRLNRNAWSSLPASACTLGVAGLEGNDRITKYNYDAANAVLSTISGYGTSLQRTDRTNTYSPVNGLLTSEADGKGNVTTYKYDNFNRLFKTVFPTPANGTVESTTDYTQTNYKTGSGLVDSVRLRDGLVINFSEYDPLGRVKTKSGALSESFTYNNFNQVVTHTNNSTGGVSQTSSYVFNSLGWLKSESRVAGGVSLGSVSYGHDAFGRRTSLTWPDSFSVSYDYKFNGVESEYLRKITESGGALLASFDYYDNGRRKSLTRGNGVVTSYGYNDLDQLKNQSTDVGGTSTADDIAETFIYTVSGQLKNHSLTVANNNYVYIPTVAAAINYTPDALNRVANVNGAIFCYDGRGNLTIDNAVNTACTQTQSNATTYSYNANNLLLNATTGGVATTLSYDAENRLHSVTKSGNTTKFAYDGTDLIAETNASNTILRRYVHGPETDDPIVWYEGSGTTDKRYYTANRQGSIVGVTLQNGLSTSINAYDEYGIQQLNTIGRFQYTGQTWIPEIGLYYYKARFYSPTLGRFMQTDPVGYKDGMNWYAYVGNDPVNNTDPTGMVCEGTGDKSKCTIDQVNIGSRKEPNWVSRADGIKSGRVTEKQLGKLEGNITKAYAAAQKLGDGTVTIKGTGDVKDISVSGNQIAGALGKATLRADNQKFFDRPAANASTSYANQTVTFNSKGLGLSNYAQMRTTVHEGMHLLSDTKVWNDNSKYRFKHQEPFGDAAEDVLKNSGYEE